MCVQGQLFFVVGPNFVKDGPVFSVLVRNIFWWEIRLLRFGPSFLYLFDFLSAIFCDGCGCGWDGMGGAGKVDF